MGGSGEIEMKMIHEGDTLKVLVNDTMITVVVDRIEVSEQRETIVVAKPHLRKPGWNDGSPCSCLPGECRAPILGNKHRMCVDPIKSMMRKGEKTDAVVK
jgi:hypothetical protein